MNRLFYMIFLALTLFPNRMFAQFDLNFTKLYTQCEDQWVMFKPGDDSISTFGFIYIDEEAGLTFNQEGYFKIIDGQVSNLKKMDSIGIKVRLEPNRNMVAIIPEELYGQLKIKRIPNWLHYYKQDTNAVKRLYKWGYLYNKWGDSKKALPYLEKANQTDPKFPGLQSERAFAYNVIKDYKKTIEILTQALLDSPGDCYQYKELSFAYAHLGELENAGKSAKTGIKICDEKTLKCELAYTVAAMYYLKKDKKSFRNWAKKTLKYAKKGDVYCTNIDKMKKALEQ